MHTYYTTNNYVRRIFGKKVYKLSLSAATTCPNRDGKVGVGGCTFCSAGGSGDFAACAALPIEELIEMLLQVKWWDFEPEKLVDFLPLLCDPDVKKVREQLVICF